MEKILHVYCFSKILGNEVKIQIFDKQICTCAAIPYIVSDSKLKQGLLLPFQDQGDIVIYGGGLSSIFFKL
jgi:hypothetical protein